MKKFLKVFFTALLCLILVVCALVPIIWGKEISTLKTVTQVEDNKYLYTMEYKAPYDLDEVIASDIDENSKLLQYVVSKVGKGIPIHIGSSQVVEDEGEHCTSFQARNSDGSGYLYGRNYDFYKNPTMVTFSHPEDGYASVAVSDMSHFGYSLDKVPEKFLSKVLCLAAVYAPVDGMNEKGLCTSIMALPKQASQQSTGKHSVGTTILMRLFLDRCATVEEALEIVNSFDIRHDVSVGSGYHYMVADAQGHCAVIEFDLFDGWKTMVVEKPEDMNYMLVTNHLLAPKYYTTEPDPVLGNPNSHSWWRFETADAYLSERNGALSFAEAQKCLSDVHWKDLVWPDGMVEDTQYSNVYDQSALTLALRPWNDYDRTFMFNLK